MLIEDTRRRPLSRNGWFQARFSTGFALVLCIALFCTLIGLRNYLVSRIPMMAQIYAAAGVRVNLAGVEFRAIEARILREADGEQLSVEGEIENVSIGKKRIKALDITLKSGTDDVIYRWKVEVPKKTLAAGETLKFIARLENPPADFASVRVNLAR